MSRRRLSFVLSFVICVFFFVGSSCAQKASVSDVSEKVGIKVGERVPDFTLKSLSGKKVNIMKAVSGNKAVLLNFFTTWCPYCVAEIPELQKLNQTYGKKGLKILAINLRESQRKVSSFVAMKGIDYTVLLDEEGVIGDMFGIMGIPHNILLDSKGIIRYRGVGLPPEEELISSD